MRERWSARKGVRACFCVARAVAESRLAGVAAARGAAAPGWRIAGYRL